MTEKKNPTTEDDGSLVEPVDATEAERRAAVAAAEAAKREEVQQFAPAPAAPLEASRGRFEGGGGGGGRQPHDVRLNRTRVTPTADQVLWVLIREATNRISFPAYFEFMNEYLARPSSKQRGSHQASLPFSHVNAYGLLKSGTETFLETQCGIVPPAAADGGKLKGVHYQQYTPDELFEQWKCYAADTKDAQGNTLQILPYLDIIRRKLGEYDIQEETTKSGGFRVLSSLIQERLANPPMVELIWSYWNEEGMLAQTMAAIARRFQNVRSGGRDPLANLELDPLRPLNNILWGYLQDEQHRLNVMRRAYEYDHHYGFTLHGKALKNFRPADTRSRFLEAFHNLLHLTNGFFRQDDDTTVVADGFPLLAALKDVHLLLTQGGHNQYGDLPWTARQEMLIEQWILARPEMREFIGGRIMVAYPEQWMDRVDSMKSLQGWDDTSSVHFRDLATFGEQILLSIRYGAWVQAILPDQAANWARFWRPQIQGYVHAYRAVTGVDLRAEQTDSRPLAERNLPPSVHLRNRLLAQGRAR